MEWIFHMPTGSHNGKYGKQKLFKDINCCTRALTPTYIQVEPANNNASTLFNTGRSVYRRLPNCSLHPTSEITRKAETVLLQSAKQAVQHPVV